MTATTVADKFAWQTPRVHLLAQVSDLHLDGGARARERAQGVFRFLRRLPRPVDGVLLTGDIADHGRPEEYDEARQLLSGGPRVLTCPGNHDVRETYRQCLLGGPPSAAPANQVHDLDGLRVVMCDSSVPGRAEGLLEEETLAWLEEQLLTPGHAPPTIVAFHHPPVRLHSPFIDAIGLQNPEPLANLLSRCRNVVAVLTGHAHTAAATTFAGFPLLVAPGVVSTLRLPWETDVDLDQDLPPAIAFHVLDDDLRLTTHYRFLPEIG